MQAPALSCETCATDRRGARGNTAGNRLPQPMDIGLDGKNATVCPPMPIMLDHVSITVSDLGRAGRFYDAVMTALGYPCVYREDFGIGYGQRSRPGDDAHSYISVFPGKQVVADRRHYAFRASSRAAVDAFHAAAVAAGGRDDGAPGLRTDYHDAYYAAFVLDPDGNRIEAVCHQPAAP
jgi:catechol 2,3-dioxygenase-like lactoylglutathione lyase family enzyme